MFCAFLVRVIWAIARGSYGVYEPSESEINKKLS